MEDFARRDDERAPDLATLVLADAQARASSGSRFAGHDPRSILILAIVVATLAAVVAWTASIGNGNGASKPEKAASVSSPRGALVARETAPTKPVAAPVANPIVAGMDLQIGRITTERSGSGGALVHVGLRNGGRDPITGAAGAQLVVLVDGERAGSAPIDAIEPEGAAIAVDVPLDRCRSGAHSLVVIADPAGVLREANERNNAQSLGADFTC